MYNQLKYQATINGSDMREDIYEAVKSLLEKDNSGHGLDHIERVRNLSLLFAEKEGADKEVVDLAALLHEVDDYKIFGEDSAKNLTNASRILNSHNVTATKKAEVLEIIQTMGYNKSLEGIRPNTLEGAIVSDADMCDAIGAQGILRTYAYNSSKGNVFFDKTLKPENSTMSASDYRASKKSHCVQHFFDKLLKIPSILITESGKEEANKRQKIMIDFLYELFSEENAEDWTIHLDGFLDKRPQEI